MYFIISLILVIAWMVVIFFLSEMPSDESNLNSKKIVNKIIEETVETSANETTQNNVNNVDPPKIKKKDNEVLENINYIFRKFAHAGVYFVLSILVLNLFLQIKNKLDIKFIMLSIACCFAYACTDEFHQLYVVGRTGQFMDVAIDTAGAIAGTIFFYILYKLINKQKSIKLLT